MSQEASSCLVDIRTNEHEKIRFKDVQLSRDKCKKIKRLNFLKLSQEHRL